MYRYIFYIYSKSPSADLPAQEHRLQSPQIHVLTACECASDTFGLIDDDIVPIHRARWLAGFGGLGIAEHN